MPRVIWAEQSISDLRGIDAYLSDHDPAAASRILRTIRSKAAILATFPLAGPPLTDELRSLRIISTNYVLLYKITDRRVEILRVRHGSEDWRHFE